MFYIRNYTTFEWEAIDYLKSLGIKAPSRWRMEWFEREYRRLFNIYPDLHYIYLYHKFGSDYAKDTVSKNMQHVSNSYVLLVQSEKEKEATNNSIQDASDNYDWRYEFDTPFEGVTQ